MKFRFISAVAGLAIASTLVGSALAVDTGVPLKKTAVIGACVSTAIDTRDSAIMAALSTYYTSVNASLQTRKDALKAAWLLTDTTARKAALKAAWATFKGTWKTSAKALNASRKKAWADYATYVKATCKTTVDDAAQSATDNQL